jgi:hypothetical protein
MTQGGGRGFAKVSRDIFSCNFEPYSSILACFKRHYLEKIYCHITQRHRGRGRGSKITQKSVTYFLNGPLEELKS